MMKKHDIIGEWPKDTTKSQESQMCYVDLTPINGGHIYAYHLFYLSANERSYISIILELYLCTIQNKFLEVDFAV